MIQYLTHGTINVMFPVLFTIGKIPVSSYGLFLSLSFFFGLFLIWRLARAWDLNEEKILDLTILSFFGGLIGARIYFVALHFSLFSQHPLSIIIFNRIPGFSFWGALLGSAITLYYFSKKQKIDFWMIADIASVGFIGGLILSNLGCFLGGCSVGIVSKLFLAVNMVGEVGKRFPVQILESFLFAFALRRLWSHSTHFHERGRILSSALIYIGVIKLLTESLKANHNEGVYFSGVLIILGIYIFYRNSKRNLTQDLQNFVKYLISLFTSAQTRKRTLALIIKYCYNQKTSISWGFRNWQVSLKKNLRRLNVRFSYKNN